MYDYIIVGGGSAGCVLANRLSADPSIQVCLLEAGPPDSSPFIRMPLGLVRMMMSKKLNWHYFTTPQAARRPPSFHAPRQDPRRQQRHQMYMQRVAVADERKQGAAPGARVPVKPRRGEMNRA